MLLLDSKTLLAVLFIGNSTSTVILTAFHITNREFRKNDILKYFLWAKLLQACGYLLILLRGSILDIISINIGVSLLWTGFYFESGSVINMMSSRYRGLGRFMLGVTAVCIVAFQVIETVYHLPPLRVAAVSSGIFLILFIPNVVIFLDKQASRFKKSAGIFYSLVLLLLIPRIIYALSKPNVNMFTNSLNISFTYIALLLLLIFSLPSFLLLIKEEADYNMLIMATTDQLTGLSNRHYFFKLTTNLLEEHKNSLFLVIILFIDIDNLKEINDKHGHLFGDAVIERVGGIISQSVRTEDLACRYGGEEFVVFIPNAEMQVGHDVAHRIMREILKTTFPENPAFEFTVSIGITTGHLKQSETIYEYISRADQALYQAKRTGKNKIVDYAEVNER